MRMAMMIASIGSVAIFACSSAMPAMHTAGTMTVSVAVVRASRANVSYMEPMMSEKTDLADEIERRGLKFADLPPGLYEAPSEYETEMILAALRATDR